MIIRNLAALACGIAVCLAAPAMAKNKDDSTKPPAERKSCRAAVGTGTIMRARICHTKAEWDAIDGANAARAGTQLDQRDRSSISGGGVNTGVGT